MSVVDERHRVVINKFHELLRSGKDYSVRYMCEEAGKHVYIAGGSAMNIINSHYQEVITEDMISFIKQLECPRDEEIKQFSEKFQVCRRESILLIRYIRRNGKG